MAATPPMTAEPRRPTIDIVVPLYNEEAVIAAFHARLMAAVTPLRREHEVRIYYVDDGSTDGTGTALGALAASDAGVTVVELSRNFGHQAALTAGLDLASGDALVTLDGDGQHPPELIPRMVALCEAGYDVVLGQRVASGAASPLKRWTSAGFSWLLGRIADTDLPPGTRGDDQSEVTGACASGLARAAERERER